MKKVNILIADDHKLFRETLSFLINASAGYQVIASCGESDEAVEVTKAEQPDIVLMDINLQPFSGIDATRKIMETTTSAKVIGMSVHANPIYAKKMMQMGARGYVTKNSSKDEVFTAISKVMQGGTYICQEIKNILAEHLFEPTLPDGLPSLTEKEMQVVELIRRGFSSKEIAVEMGISRKTAEVSRQNILKKLKQKNSASLVNFMHNNAAHFDVNK